MWPGGKLSTTKAAVWFTVATRPANEFSGVTIRFLLDGTAEGVCGWLWSAVDGGLLAINVPGSSQVCGTFPVRWAHPEPAASAAARNDKSTILIRSVKSSP